MKGLKFVLIWFTCIIALCYGYSWLTNTNTTLLSFYNGTFKFDYQTYLKQISSYEELSIINFIQRFTKDFIKYINDVASIYDKNIIIAILETVLVILISIVNILTGLINLVLSILLLLANLLLKVMQLVGINTYKDPFGQVLRVLSTKTYIPMIPIP